MHGIGIENELLVLSEIKEQGKLLETNTGQVDVWTTLPETFFSYVFELLSEYENVVPMKILLDYAGRRAIELVTKRWKNRKLHEYISDLTLSKQAVTFLLNSKVIPFLIERIKNEIHATKDRKQKSRIRGTLKMLQMFDHNKTMLFNEGSGVLLRYPMQGFGISYTGSYHLNWTLPHSRSIDDENFKSMHLKAAMALQWLEPLLVSLLGSPSPLAPMSGGQHTSLSVRLQDESLAMVLGRNLVDRDVSPDRGSMDDMFRQDVIFQFTPRHFRSIYNAYDKGIPKWMKMMTSDKKEDIAKRTEAHRKIVQNRSYWGLLFVGTDFRRDSSKGPRFGFEFRVFDNFDSSYLHDIMRLMIYVFDHGVLTMNPSDSKHNAFISNGANKHVFESISTGWATKVNATYIRELSRIFDVKLTGSSTTDVIVNELSLALFHRYHGKGVFSTRMLDASMYATAPVIPNVNREMWEKYFAQRFPDLIHSMKSNFSMTAIAKRFPGIDVSLEESRLRALRDGL